MSPPRELATLSSVRQQYLANQSPGPSRCFPFWQELLACYVMNTDSDDTSGAEKCLPALEDYYECLHHRKEVRPLALPASLYFRNSLRSGEQILISDSVNRRPGRGHYSRHIGERRRQVRGRMRRMRGRLGVWGCWVRRKRRKRL